jgi:hypothetical protein
MNFIYLTINYAVHTIYIILWYSTFTQIYTHWPDRNAVLASRQCLLHIMTLYKMLVDTIVLPTKLRKTNIQQTSNSNQIDIYIYMYAYIRITNAFLVPCKHIMVRKCLLLSQRNNKCKNCIKMKNVNIHHYLFLSETYEPVARDTCPPPPFGKILKSWIFSIL